MHHGGAVGSNKCSIKLATDCNCQNKFTIPQTNSFEEVSCRIIILINEDNNINSKGTKRKPWSFCNSAVITNIF